VEIYVARIIRKYHPERKLFIGFAGIQNIITSSEQTRIVKLPTKPVIAISIGILDEILLVVVFGLPELRWEQKDISLNTTMRRDREVLAGEISVTIFALGNLVF